MLGLEPHAERAGMAQVNDLTGAALAANANDLLRYFRRRVGDDAAPDLLTETLLTAWRRFHALPQEPEQARSWLFGIARNILLNHQRSERRRHRLADRIRHTLGSTAHTAAADAGLDVRDAISRLDPGLAELVRLVHWEGFTLAQAAEILEIPASTARNHYQHAKRELRTALASPVKN
ncbi:MAG: polymerase sigma factor [Marmoricola sp.]|nr:polymerase sigma factor [Marmoricola sp.]